MSALNLFGSALVLGALALVGCGDDMGGHGGGGGENMGGHGATQHGSGGSGGDGSTTQVTSSASGTSTGTGDVAPSAPVLDEVAAMHGALHLYWTNVASDCDEIEGERMTPADDFAVFFTVPGTVDNEADDGATDPATTYTYRVRCKRGETYSEYSNELSASPE